MYKTRAVTANSSWHEIAASIAANSSWHTRRGPLPAFSNYRQTRQEVLTGADAAATVASKCSWHRVLHPRRIAMPRQQLRLHCCSAKHASSCASPFSWHWYKSASCASRCPASLSTLYASMMRICSRFASYVKKPNDFPKLGRSKLR